VAAADPGKPSAAVVKPIAAGGKVVAGDLSATTELLRRSCSDAVAVEMEGFGFLRGAYVDPAVDALVVRGVSDLLGGKHHAQDQHWQPAAARHAAAFAFAVLDSVSQARRRSWARLRWSAAAIILALIASAVLYNRMLPWREPPAGDTPRGSTSRPAGPPTSPPGSPLATPTDPPGSARPAVLPKAEVIVSADRNPDNGTHIDLPAGHPDIRVRYQELGADETIYLLVLNKAATTWFWHRCQPLRTPGHWECLSVDFGDSATAPGQWRLQAIIVDKAGADDIDATARNAIPIDFHAWLGLHLRRQSDPYTVQRR